MATVIIELPQQAEQTGINLRRWEELLADSELARIEGRIETDRHGHVIMSPPPAATHGNFQFRIGFLLQQLLPHGRVLTECPISTADGVKAADVAWASSECMRELGNRVCFPRAPEICVEVLSPGNTKSEINEKKLLYFDAGAHEVWICSKSGAVSFFGSALAAPLRASKLCPEFPHRIELR
jgi:Uma2 family endonuclease